jgi:hypothetical protein
MRESRGQVLWALGFAGLGISGTRAEASALLVAGGGSPAQLGRLLDIRFWFCSAPRDALAVAADAIEPVGDDAVGARAAAQLVALAVGCE